MKQSFSRSKHFKNRKRRLGLLVFVEVEHAYGYVTRVDSAVIIDVCVRIPVR